MRRIAKTFPLGTGHSRTGRRGVRASRMIVLISRMARAREGRITIRRMICLFISDANPMSGMRNAGLPMISSFVTENWSGALFASPFVE